MSRKKEPAVISLAFLTSVAETAAEEKAKKEPASVPRPPVDLTQVKELSLSFRGLLRIENLQILGNLRKLQLDNNSLVRIENLDCLINLEWLDLSFNLITKIEGLENLKKLTDLSLFNNKITKIENLENCTELECLSLGNNHIEDLESILYFRKLPKLASLTLEGNPLCGIWSNDPAVTNTIGVGDDSMPLNPSSSITGLNTTANSSSANIRSSSGRNSTWEQYRAYCHAFLTHVKYLDYQLITEAERKAALEGGVSQDVVDMLRKTMREEAEANEKKEKKEKERAELVSANVDIALEMEELLFPPDPDFSKLQMLPIMPHLMQKLRETLGPAGQDLIQDGLQLHKEMAAELEEFTMAREAMLQESADLLLEGLQEWKHKLKKASAKHKARATVATEAELLKLRSELPELFEKFFATEVHLHEDVFQVLNVYENARIEFKNRKLNMYEHYFRICEETEAQFSLELLTHALRAAEEADRLQDDLGDESYILLRDKEALSEVLTSAQSARVSQILKRETLLKRLTENSCKEELTTLRENETSRNRSRMYELKQVKESLEKLVEEALVTEGGIGL